MPDSKKINWAMFDFLKYQPILPPESQLFIQTAVKEGANLKDLTDCHCAPTLQKLFATSPPFYLVIPVHDNKESLLVWPKIIDLKKYHCVSVKILIAIKRSERMSDYVFNINGYVNLKAHGIDPTDPMSHIKLDMYNVKTGSSFVVMRRELYIKIVDLCKEGVLEILE